MREVDPRLKEWANENQARIIDAVIEHGGIKAAARELGINHSNVSRAVAIVRTKAMLQGYAPEYGYDHPVPPTHVAKGVSQLRDADGKVKLTWVKSRLEDQAAEVARQALKEAFFEDAPELDVPAEPRDYSTDVIPWIQIGDAHVGMLAHAAEVGESFDVKIAERELCGAIGQLIDEMPGFYERVVINDLGDFTHYENFQATTEASGHALDFDTRYPKMIRSYSRIMRFIVERALTKAKTVDVIINQGNHSRTNDIWMAELLRAAYGHTGRVNVLDNDSVFIAYRMGRTFVMVHHSDKCKPDKLASVMATDFAKDWGETEFRYIDIGHIHHRMVAKEHAGVTIESWNNLAARDKYAHDGGWRSRQSITVVLRSKTYGEIGRRVLSIQEVRDRLGDMAPRGKVAFVAA